MKTSWFMTMPATGKYYGVNNIIMGDTAASRGMLQQRALTQLPVFGEHSCRHNC
jgi:hypothetical protein